MSLTRDRVSMTHHRGHVRTIVRGVRFRRLVGVRLSSQFVDGLFQAALAGSLLFNPQKAASPVAIASGFAVLLLPYSVIGPYVGVFLDRWSRRTVIYVANLLRAGLVIPAVLCIWGGRDSVPYAVTALFIIGVNRFFLSGLSAAQPHVVPEEHLVTANALSTTLGTLAYSLGLGTAAVTLNTVLPKDNHGYAGLAATAAVGYTLSALVAYRSFGPDDLGPDDQERAAGGLLPAVIAVGRGMLAGLRHLARRRSAARAMLAQTVHRGLYGALTIMTLLLYRRYFNHGEDYSKSLSGLAEVIVAGGLGSLLAAFLTPVGTRRLGGRRWMVLLFTAAGGLILALGLPFRATLMVAATFGLNAAAQGTKIVVDTTLQRECQDDFRGRVFSVNDTAFNLSFVLGLFIGALSLPPDGHSPTALALVAAGYLALAGWYGLSRTPS